MAGEAVFADQEFPDTLKDITEEKGYPPEQVFNAHVCCTKSLSCVHLFETSWTAARLLCPWDFSRQAYWSALGPRCHKDICEEKGDLPEQVFNADESVLFWGKKCHEGHSLVKKRSKLQDLRLILWFCTNAVRFMIRTVLNLQSC